MSNQKSFASDNNAVVHKDIFQAMILANQGDAIGYGDDQYTRKAEHLFREHFGPDSQVFFMLTGTGANVAAIGHIARPYQAVICTDKAHLENDECGAPEKISGCKLLTVPSPDGRLNRSQLTPFLSSLGFQHHVQPKVLSITQSTEMGTVYRIEELLELSAFARKHNLYLHVDGARLANAAAYLNVGLKEITTDVGVDVVSFGGTKNGAMAAEAVVFINPEIAEGFQYSRKQSMQLLSKMRYVGAQFSALLQDNLWYRNARQANAMAALLARKLEGIEQVTITQPVETNAVFAVIPGDAIEELRKQYYFYTWDAPKGEVRWMTNYSTTEKDIDLFVATLTQVLN